MIDENKVRDMGQISSLSYRTIGSALQIGRTFSGEFVVEGEIFSLDSSYTVIDYADTATDMQAILLVKNDSAGNPTGEYVIAFRGTETDSWLDIKADGLTGLINYNPQVSDARDFVQAMMTTHNIAAANLSLTGHSLGGIITQAVGADLHIQGYAYNPYGANLLSSLPSMPLHYYAILGQMLDIFDMGAQNDSWVKDNLLTISFQDDGEINGDVLSNLATQFGELIAGNNHIGGVLPIFGDNVGLGDGHSMSVMNVAIQHYNEILSYFTHATTMSDLSLIYMLEGEDGFNRVEQIFTELNITVAPEKSLSFEAFGVLDSSGNVVAESSFNISALVNTGIAYRYALLNLNTFAVLGDESLYNFFNQQGDLDLYNPETGVGSMTQSYINDRALMLENLIISNTQNDDTPESIHKISFYDYESDISFFTEEPLIDFGPRDRYTFGDGNDNFLTGMVGEQGNDHLYGMGGGDNLLGQEGKDYLEGGLGNDALTGGEGNDYLHGGAGSDTYIFNTGDGKDYIIDAIEIENGSPTKNILKIDNRTISNLSAIDEVSAEGYGIYRELDANGQPVLDADGNELRHVYTYNADGMFISHLDNDDLIIITDFDPQDNNFGLALHAYTSSIEPETASTEIIVGDGVDPNIDRYIDRAENTSYIYDASLYQANDPESPLLAYFGFNGGDSNDQLTGTDEGLRTAGFHDVLRGQDGDDVIQGELDVTSTAGDADWLVGGKGSDIIHGGGNSEPGKSEFLFGLDDERSRPKTSTAAGVYDFDRVAQKAAENSDDRDFLFGDSGIDVIAAGSGDDLLSGGEGNDLLFGNVGADIFVAGEGNDWVFGDSYLLIESKGASGFSVALDSRYIGELGNFNDTIDLGGGDDIARGEAGDDTIFGGAGSDTILGDQFNDIDAHRLLESSDAAQLGYRELAWNLHGNDMLFGGDGIDKIFGNGGDDYIFGGSGDALGLGEQLLIGDDFVLSGDQHGNDVIEGGEHTDRIIGGGGKDTLVGGSGDDYLHGDSVDFTYNHYINNELRWSSNALLAGEFHGDDILQGGMGNDYLSGDGGADRLYGGDGDDTLYGDGESQQISSGGISLTDYDVDLEFHGIDLLEGGAGNDKLYGGSGDDILTGGQDTDLLYGGGGNDEYRFSMGDGNDTIIDTSGRSTLSFSSVSLPELRIQFLPNNVLIRYGENNQITLSTETYGRVEALRVLGSEVTIADHVDVTNGTTTYYGSAADDTITLSALQQVDTILAGYGDDTLVLDGTGIYNLDGGSGADSFVIHHTGQQSLITNIGSSTLQFADNLNAADIVFSRDNDNLYIEIDRAGSFSQFVIEGYISSFYSIESITFSDGEIWNHTQLLENTAIQGTNESESLYGVDAQNETFLGLAGADRIYAYGGNDKLIGGLDNDQLYGGAGDNIYQYTLGDGTDRVYISETGLNTIDLKGILPEEVSLHRSGNNNLSILLPETDRIDVYSERGTNDFELDEIRFDDGTVWDYDALIVFLSQGSENSEVLYGGKAGDVIDALGGYDTVYGLDGNDELYGGSGDDRLFGGDQDDTLIGGEDNDSLVGGDGNDTYFYGLGDGLDTINNFDRTTERNDRIVFGSAIAESDVTVTRLNNSDLIVYVKGEQSLKIENFFSSANYQIDSIEFSNAMVWGRQDLLAYALNSSSYDDYLLGSDSDDIINGLAGDDTILGVSGTDTLNGGSGNDQIFGGTGTNLLIGAEGDDALYGGSGNNAFEYRRGDGLDSVYINSEGIDKIIFAEGITPDNVRVKRGGYSQLTIEVDGDTAISTYYSFSSDSTLNLDQIEFSDGTIWERIDFISKVKEATSGNDNLYADLETPNLSGLIGQDVLSGDDQANELTGGIGDDILIGGRGNDTYIFSAAHDLDIIRDYSNDPDSIDIIQFDASVNPEDIQLHRLGNNLLLENVATHDEVTVERYFYTSYSSVQSAKEIHFFDGTIWNSEYIELQLASGPDDDERLFGTDVADTLNGFGGNDVIYGLDGNDQLSGGKGSDSLIGGEGDDSYYYYRGDGFDSISDSSSGFNSLYLPDLESNDVVLHRTSNGYIGLDLLDESGGIRVGANSNSSADDYSIQRIEFSDGSVWSTADIIDKLKTGTPLNDLIEGTELDDVLAGEQGDDSLFGGLGDDVYLFSVGGGNDHINDVYGNNILRFEAGVTPEDLVIWRDIRADWPESYDLHISSRSSDLTIQVQEFYDLYRENPGGFSIEFFDSGEVITYDELLTAPDFSLDLYYTTLPLELSALPSNTSAEWSGAWGYGVFLSALDDTIFFHNGSIWGGEGDDIIASAASPATVNGQIDGGLGQDTIYAGGQSSSVYGGPIGEGDEYGYYRSYLDYGGLPFPEGSDVNDTSSIFPDDSHDTIYAEGGDDFIQGGSGNDWIASGLGDDQMAGGRGNDVYFFQLGDGQDRVISLEETPGIIGHGPYRQKANTLQGSDVLRFGLGIEVDHVLARREGSYLIFEFTNSQDSFTVERYFSQQPEFQRAIKTVEFADGTVWGASEILAAVEAYTDTDEGGKYGSENNDTLVSESGGQLLQGKNGNDVLIGSAGNDYLIGGNHNDTYVFEAGFGNDIIRNYDDTLVNSHSIYEQAIDRIYFDASINRGALLLSREGDDLLVVINDDSIRVLNHFLGTGLGINYRYAVDAIEFEDGVNWDLDAINAFAETGEHPDGEAPTLIEGSRAHDILVGTRGDDIFIGGAGNDTLRGKAGDDIFIVEGTGQGFDRVIGGKGFDTLKGGDGNDIFGLRRYMISDSLEQIDGGLGLNRIVGNKTNNRFDFSETELISIAAINGRAGDDEITGSRGADRIVGGAGNDSLDGGSGDDRIIGSDGDDTIVGGQGNDVLKGGNGADTYVFRPLDGRDAVVLNVQDEGVDTLVFEQVGADDLWFRQSGDHLVINTVGSDDRVAVRNWFAEGQEAQVIEAGGQTLDTTQLDQLIAAMAVFDVPKGVGNVIPQQTQEALQPLLASAWQ